MAHSLKFGDLRKTVVHNYRSTSVHKPMELDIIRSPLEKENT